MPAPCGKDMFKSHRYTAGEYKCKPRATENSWAAEPRDQRPHQDFSSWHFPWVLFHHCVNQGSGKPEPSQSVKGGSYSPVCTHRSSTLSPVQKALTVRILDCMQYYSLGRSVLTLDLQDAPEQSIVTLCRGMLVSVCMSPLFTSSFITSPFLNCVSRKCP